MIKSLVDRFMDLVRRGRDGKNQGIKVGLKKLEKIIAGIQRSIYTVIAGSTGSGKTTYALYTYIYKPLMEKLGQDDFKIVYYSLEMTAEVLMAKLASMFIWEQHGIEITFDVILSRDEIISEEHFKILEETYEWLTMVEKHLVIYDKAINSDGVYAHLKGYASQHGEFKSVGEHQEVYIPKVKDQYVIVVIDHIGLIRRKAGQSKKDAIDATSSYLIYFRNKCGYSPVVLMQVNRTSSSMDRRNAEMQELQLDDIKDSGTPSEDAEIVLALFNPAREKMSNYRDYKIKLIKEYFRSILVLKNRYGEADKMVPLNFFGSVGIFRELPPANELSASDYERYTSLSYSENTDKEKQVEPSDEKSFTFKL